MPTTQPVVVPGIPWHHFVVDLWEEIVSSGTSPRLFDQPLNHFESTILRGKPSTDVYGHSGDGNGILICSIPWASGPLSELKTMKCWDSGATFTWQSLQIVLQCATKHFDIVKELLFDLGKRSIVQYQLISYLSVATVTLLLISIQISFRSSWSPM